MKLLNWYISYVWPIHRWLTRGLARRCVKCITSEKSSPLNRDGICSECLRTNVVTPAFSLSESADEIIEVCDRGGEPYEAAILLSGGKDSCYLLSQLEKRYRLNLVAIFIDNGFAAPQAIANAQAICRQTGTDLIVTNWNGAKISLRQAFLDMKSTNGTAYDVVDFTDGSKIFRLGQLIARLQGTDWVFTGLSREQAVLHGGQIKVENDLGLMISPLIDWNPSDEEIYEYLEHAHGMSRKLFDPSLTNHTLIPVMCAIDVLNHGYCSFEKEFANRVRRGEADRKKWLHTFESLEYFVKRGILNGMMEKELSKLDLTIQDVTTQRN